MDTPNTDAIVMPEFDAAVLDDASIQVDAAVSEMGVDGSMAESDAMAANDAALEIDASPEPSSCRLPAPSVGEFCTGVPLDEYHCESYRGPAQVDATLVGSTTPSYIIKDVQPQSCGYEQYYGLKLPEERQQWSFCSGQAVAFAKRKLRSYSRCITSFRQRGWWSIS